MVIGGLVYSLYGAYRIYSGQEFRYLWVGDWVARRSADPTPGQPDSSSEAGQRQGNTKMVVIAVGAVLVLCMLCAVLGVVVLAGIIYLSSSAFVPPLLHLV